MDHYIQIELANGYFNQMIGPVKQLPRWKPPVLEITCPRPGVSLPIGDIYAYSASELRACDPPEITHHYTSTGKVRTMRHGKGFLNPAILYI
jgi:hypothetical protein